jgi:hypothetical protein
MVRCSKRIDHMGMDLQQERVIELKVHSSRDRCLVLRSNQSRLVLEEHIENIVESVRCNRSIASKEMVEIQQCIVEFVDPSYRVRSLGFHRSQSIGLSVVDMERSLGFLHCRCSIGHMEMAHLLGYMSEWMVRSNKHQLLESSISQSIQLEMERIVGRLIVVDSIRSIEPMGMALQSLEHIVELTGHNSRGLLEVGRSIGPSGLGLVRIERIVEMVHSSRSIERWGMVLAILGGMIGLEHHSSREGLLGFRIVLPILLVMASIE